MNKILIFLMCFMLHSELLAEQKNVIKIDKRKSYSININGKNFLLVPDYNDFMSAFPDRKSPIACDGTLFCYKCCTGHNSVTKRFCESNFKNWKRGHDCNCEK